MGPPTITQGTSVQRRTIAMTDPYWVPGPLYSVGHITYQNEHFNDLGFRNEIPVPLPISVGQSYFGSNEGALGLPKQLVFSNQGEYFARGGYLRTNNGKPMVNIYSPEFNFTRASVTKQV
jgi:hypothetical protein